MAAKQRYDQLCPVSTVLDLVGNRWALLVLRELLLGPRRFKEILEGLDGASTDMLTSRLRELETAGMVERLDDRRYARTEMAELLRPVVRSMLVFSLSTGLFMDGLPDGGERSVGPDPIRRVLGMVGIVGSEPLTEPTAGTYLFVVGAEHRVLITSKKGGYDFSAIEADESPLVDGELSISPDDLVALMFGGLGLVELSNLIDADTADAQAVADQLVASIDSVWGAVRKSAMNS